MKAMTRRIGAVLVSAFLAFAGAGAYGATVQAANQEELNAKVAAAAAGDIVEITAAGTYKLPSAIPQNITIKAASGVAVQIDATGSGNICGTTSGATFEGLEFSFGNTSYHGFQSGKALTFNDCTLNGLIFSYNAMTFNGCTFKQTEVEYAMWCYAGNIAYSNCTFECHGKFLNLYNEGNGEWSVKCEDCLFSSDVANKAALNVKDTCGSIELPFCVTIDRCRTAGEFPAAAPLDGRLLVIDPLVQVDDIKEVPSEKINKNPNNLLIKLDGKQVYPNPPAIVVKDEVEEEDFKVDIAEELAEKEEVAKEAANEVRAAVSESLSSSVVAGQAETGIEAVTPEDAESSYLSVAFKGLDVKVEADGEGVVAKLTSVTYEVKPISVKGTEETQISNDDIAGRPLTFNLPVAENFGAYAQVHHRGEDIDETFVEPVRGAGSEQKYVKITASHFSTFTLTSAEEDATQTLAWKVAAAEAKPFAPAFVKLCATGTDGARTISLRDADISETTEIVGSNGWTWAGAPAEATFEVQLETVDHRLIATSASATWDALKTAGALQIITNEASAVVATPHLFGGFAIADEGEYVALTNVFGANATVTPVLAANPESEGAFTYVVKLANDLTGPVVLPDNLGPVTLDLNGHTVSGTNGVDGVAGGVAIQISTNATIATVTRPTLLTVVNGNTSVPGAVQGGNGALGVTGSDGGLAIAVDTDKDVKVSAAGANGQSANPLIRGGDAGAGYGEEGTRGTPGEAVTAGYLAEGTSENLVSSGDTFAYDLVIWAHSDVAYDGDLPAGVFKDAADGMFKFYGRDEKGAKFDFATLPGAFAGATIEFEDKTNDVSALEVPAGMGLTFKPSGEITRLVAKAPSSMFAVGGALGAATGVTTWKDLVFEDEEMEGFEDVFRVNGGAISMDGGAFVIDGCSFTGFNVDQLGGAVCAAWLTGDSVITNSTFVGTAVNRFDGSGGAIYVSALTNCAVTLTVADSSFADCVAANGGAIYANPLRSEDSLVNPAAGPIRKEDPVALVIADTTFSGNRAGVFDTVLYSGNGGAVLSTGNVTLEGNTVFTNNIASASGGAVEIERMYGDTELYGWGAATLTAGRGVVFADNAVSNSVGYVSGGAIAVLAEDFDCDLALEGALFRGNRVYGNAADYDLVGGAVDCEFARDVTIDTCVFDDNDVVAMDDQPYMYAGAVDIYETTGSALVKNSTFRYSNIEALRFDWTLVGAITNCVLVGNGEIADTTRTNVDVVVYGSTVDSAYTAYGKVAVSGGEAASTLAEFANLTNRTVAIYDGEKLYLKPNTFNPVASLGLEQPGVLDFDGVEYGSLPEGYAMGAYECPTERLVVKLVGDKIYNGTSDSNGCTFAWSLTTTNGTDAMCDELGDIATAFVIDTWRYMQGGAPTNEVGFYATTNGVAATPKYINCVLLGHEDIAPALIFIYEGTIARRDVDLGGFVVEMDDEFAWTGDEILPPVTVYDTLVTNEFGNPLVLTEGVDYLLTYTNNVGPTATAKAIIEPIHNYTNIVVSNFWITAYYVEYRYNDVVQDDLAEIHGTLSGSNCWVAAETIAANCPPTPTCPDNFAFDKFYSVTNGTAYRYGQGGEGKPVQLVLTVLYWTDVNDDDIPDRYQKNVLAKVVNGKWNVAGGVDLSGEDQMLWATFTDADGKWVRPGEAGATSHIPSASIPAAGARPGSNYKDNKDADGNARWLVLNNGHFVVTTDLETYNFDGHTMPFALYAYLRQTTASGRSHGRTSGEPADVSLEEMYGVSLFTTSFLKSGDTASIGANLMLTDAQSGAPIDNIPMAGSNVKVHMSETPGGEETVFEATVDSDSSVTAPANGDSAFYYLGL